MASILVISAHPDDETLFAGGTLAMLAQKGNDVYILETTRGEGGEVGDPPLTSRENLGLFREQEVRNAAEALGVRDIFFLPFVDPYMPCSCAIRVRHLSPPWSGTRRPSISGPDLCPQNCGHSQIGSLFFKAMRTSVAASTLPPLKTINVLEPGSLILSANTADTPTAPAPSMTSRC